MYKWGVNAPPLDYIHGELMAHLTGFEEVSPALALGR